MIKLNVVAIVDLTKDLPGRAANASITKRHPLQSYDYLTNQAGEHLLWGPGTPNYEFGFSEKKLTEGYALYEQVQKLVIQHSTVYGAREHAYAQYKKAWDEADVAYRHDVKVATSLRPK